MSTLIGLQCHVCHTAFPAEATYVCDQCFGPLEPVYDYDKARATFTRANIAARPRNIWRYRELLPIAGEPLTGFGSGFTPLIPAPRLAARLGAIPGVVEHGLFIGLARTVVLAGAQGIRVVERP